MNRRSFLKIVSATIALPVIAKAAVFPKLIIPGIERVDGITPRDLDTDARFANAIFTPGAFDSVRELVQINAASKLPHGTVYAIKAVHLTNAEIRRYVKYGRDGYAVMWETGRWAMGAKPDTEWLPGQLAHPMHVEDFTTDLHGKKTVTGRYVDLGRFRTGDPIISGSGVLTIEHIEKMRDVLESQNVPRPHVVQFYEDGPLMTIDELPDVSNNHHGVVFKR